MEGGQILGYIQNVIRNMPSDWLKLTTHRLDIYEEKLAKVQFLEQFENLCQANNYQSSALYELPTAFDYIRLGHPLSCVLEWAIARINKVGAENVISFSSQSAPILAVLRKNLLDNRKTRIAYTGNLPTFFDADSIKTVYNYNFDLLQVGSYDHLPAFEGSTIFLSQTEQIAQFEPNEKVDFHVNVFPSLGSIVFVNGEKNEAFISEIQHVRRRESIAMTPINTLAVLKNLSGLSSDYPVTETSQEDKTKVIASVQKITGTEVTPLVASSGLSMQYAIVMGLIHDAVENHQGKNIKIVVPPNCYGGTNDQARRVAACIDNVEIMDLPVDGDNDMVQSVEKVLGTIAQENAVPYIIAEIPTNPRVEVPDLIKLRDVLSKERKTPEGDIAIDPVFILDQTFCPNVHFLGAGAFLSTVRTIAYVSGSKFPSGGRCTAGYCVTNNMSAPLMSKIQKHLDLCDNEATALQYNILAEQLPSMNQRIHEAYKNTRSFVSFINDALPDAKINFVSEDLAAQGFTPSVFSLDLPTKGDTDEERETYKRALNLKLINLMINEIPDESKFCVSYGQLKGCYWTIPATSTQGTTKEGDKDYIVRASLSFDMDLELHKKVFTDFVNGI